MATLETIPLFRSLNRAELQAMRLITQERRFAAGQEIFREGAPGDGVYFVKNGLVEISAGASTRRVFSRLGPGEIFGEMSIIEHRPRSATASAAQDTEVYFLPRGEMLAFIERSPGLAFALLQQISHRLREFNQLHLREILEAERLAVVGNFARSIIHDLKNPLSIISLSAENFSNPNLTPEVRSQAQTRVRRQVQRINDLVTDILAFTEGRTFSLRFPPAWPRFPQPHPQRQGFSGRGRENYSAVQTRQWRNPRRDRGHRPRHRAGNRRQTFSALRHARQSPRHRPRPLHLQKNHRGPRRENLRPQRTPPRRDFLLHAADGKIIFRRRAN